MSNFSAKTFHPITGAIEDAMWMDDYFAHHHYGIRFQDGEIFDPYKVDCERVFPKAVAEIERLRAGLLMTEAATRLKGWDALADQINAVLHPSEIKEQNDE